MDEKINAIPIGKGEVLTEGDDLLILAIGKSVQESMIARNRLADKGIMATVVNCRFLKPIDEELIVKLALKIPTIITVEENVLKGGFGSAVLECLIDNGVNNFNMKRIGIADTFIEHGAQSILRAKYGVDASGIVSAAIALLNDKLGSRELIA